MSDFSEYFPVHSYLKHKISQLCAEYGDLNGQIVENREQISDLNHQANTLVEESNKLALQRQETYDRMCEYKELLRRLEKFAEVEEYPLK